MCETIQIFIKPRCQSGAAEKPRTLVRGGSHNLQKDIAKNIIKKTGEQIKGSVNKAVDVRDYLKEQKLITEKEHDLIKGVYGFMSDAGTHKLTSTKDQARLGKNMLIEISLLLIKNYKKYKP